MSQNEFKHVLCGHRMLGEATAAPTSGATAYAAGDIFLNSAPAASGTMGWVCVVAGSPGTWKTWGTIAA